MSVVRATSSGRRSPAAPDTIQTMTVYQQGQNIFVDAADNHVEDMEVSNVNSTNFYSPQQSQTPQSSGSISPSAIINPSQQPNFKIPDPNDQKDIDLRRRCAFFFMNPIDKFIARRQAPWKLILQFAKIILITSQLLVFGQFRYAHTNYYKDNHLAYEHLFLKDWDPTREINSYPPAMGKFALYQKETFYDYFDYTAQAFSDIEDRTIVPTRINSSLHFCMENYRQPYPNPLDHKKKKSKFEEDYYQSLLRTNKFGTEIKCIQIHKNQLANFSSHNFLINNKFEVEWYSLVEMRLNFTLITVTSRQLGPNTGPECFRFRLDIIFDNHDHDGQIPISMKSTPYHIKCPGEHEEDSLANPSTRNATSYIVKIMSIVVIFICLISVILCCRALIRAQSLAHETKNFFNEKFRVKLTRMEVTQFLNLWYVVICINDLLIIVGTILKEIIEETRTNSDLWDFCSTFLGIGNLLVWLGMLRYLAFFQKYNTIILTIQKAMPNIIRFTICVSIIYLGSVFCGWVILGPYHYKFYSLSSTSECLFSLINGDDMFATFNMVSTDRGMIWGFSRIYLYLFIIFFIYVVLSLFIAIIMDAFDEVKDHYKNGFPQSKIDEFYQAAPYDIYSKEFCDGDNISPSLLYKFWSWVMMKWYGTEFKGYQRDFGDGVNSNSNSDLAPLVT